MRILLIRYYSDKAVNTPQPKSIMRAEGVFPPLGIAYVASFLEREGHKVNIMDCQALGLSKPEIENYITGFKPDMVGITCTTPYVHGAIEAAQITKEIGKDITVVLGGPHLSLFPKEAVSFPFVDFGIIGEGEYAFAELIHQIETGKKDFKSIEGLVWKSKNKIIINPLRKPNMNLDELPFPARHLLPNDKYHVVIMKDPMTTIVAGRGCPFHCAYCFRDKYTGWYRHRTPKNVVDEIEHCIEKYRIREFSFYDDCWPNVNFLKGVCQEIIDRGIDIPWNALQRVDLISNETLALMKKVGCIRIRFGVETGSERILKIMEKGITLRQVEDAFKLTKKNKIETFAFFMVGYVTETAEDFKATINFAKKIDPDWIMFDTTIPLPGTKLWNYVVKNLRFDKNYWRDWSLGKRTDALPHLVPNADKLCGEAFKAFYLRPKFILRKIMNVRSLEDIRKYWDGAKSIIRFEGNDPSY